MAMPADSSIQTSQQQHPLRRMWRVPRSSARWLWLLCAILLYAVISFSYIRTISSPGFYNDPGRGPLARFGLITFVLLMLPLAYTLRRRFMRSLPGKAQNWLWMHTWMGVLVVLVAMFHANFDHVLYNYCYRLNCLKQENGGPIALDALFVLVGSGIFGRLLDQWQTRVIAQDASTNGVGIAQALQTQLLELEYAVERLYAGKSDLFKQYCKLALEPGNQLPAPFPPLVPHEHADFQRAYEILGTYTRLTRSLRRQQRARLIISRWRTLHMLLACLAVAIIGLHIGTAAFQGLLARLHR